VRGSTAGCAGFAGRSSLDKKTLQRALALFLVLSSTFLLTRLVVARVLEGRWETGRDLFVLALLVPGVQTGLVLLVRPLLLRGARRA
jgi:hypothetical protein